MLEVYKLSDAKCFLLNRKAVLFDLDDTLYSEIDYVKSGYAEIALSTPEITDIEQKLWSAFENGEKAIDFVLKAEGLYSPEKAAECLNIYRNHNPDIKLYSDAAELLTVLKKNGVRLGMITDGRPEGQRAKIKALGIESYFEKIIITDELGGIGFRKPNKKAYEEMQSYFNLPYSQMVYVGDNPSKDFTAPMELKMECVFFKNPNGLYSNKG